MKVINDDSILALCIRHEIEVFEIVSCTIFYLYLYALSTEYLHDSVKLLCPSLKLSAGRFDPCASNRKLHLVLSRHPSNASNLKRNLKMHPYQKKIILFTRTHPSQDSILGLTLAGVSSSSICQRIIGELYSFTNKPPWYTQIGSDLGWVVSRWDATVGSSGPGDGTGYLLVRHNKCLEKNGISKT